GEFFSPSMIARAHQGCRGGPWGSWFPPRRRQAFRLTPRGGNRRGFASGGGNLRSGGPSGRLHGGRCLGFVYAEAWNGLDHLLYLRRGDQPCALEVSGRVLVTRAPKEILVVEAMPRIVPA